MRRKIVLVLGFLFLFSAVVWAQDTANIVGTVTDTSGAVIPNAKVVVSNPDKGFARDLTSNSSGEYTAARIPIGNYVVSAETTGFQKLARSGITLAVGQTLRVDLQLPVGQMTQEVTVSGNIARVETETAAVSDVVTGTQLENLNLNGRNFLALTTMVPGAMADNGNDVSHLGHGGAAPSVSFGGVRMEYSNLEIDGGNNSDEGSGANGGDTTPSLDSIAEFRISTSTYGADVGQHAGAIIEVVTKSGTKNFHGNAHEFLRNDAIDANDWFLNRQINPPGGNAPKQPLKWNTFGYTLGGPFYIPGHYNESKTKTFFFWSEEWAKYREGAVIESRTPSVLMRQGDFSECDPVSGNPTIIAQGCTLPTDPTTGHLFAGNIVPLDPNGKALLDGLLPLPNNGVDDYVASHSLPTNYREEQIRVDQNIGDRASVFVRFTNDAWNTFNAPSLWTGSSYDTATTKFITPARAAVMHLTYNFKPNLMNEFLMSYANDPHWIYPQTGPSSPAGSVNKPSTWTMKPLFAPNASNPLLPGISLSGGTPFSPSEDSGGYGGYYNSNPIYTWKDNAAWTLGKHTLKFGFYLEKFQKNEQFGFNTQGYLSFDSGSPISTGNALADMYLGRIAKYTEGTLSLNGVPVGGYGKGHWRRTDFEPYFQDDWKVTPKLTLNLGLRYYLFIPNHDMTHPTVDSSFIPGLYEQASEALLDKNANLVVDPASGHIHTFLNYGNGLVQCGSAGILKGCVTPYHSTLGPRVGFAFDPWGNGKTSIRGGYGIYFEPGNGNEANTEGLEGNPPITQAPSGYNILGYQSIAPGAYGPPGIGTIPYYQKVPSVHQFSLSVQHEFSGNNLLGVSYAGSLGRHLARYRNLNQPAINIGTVNAPAQAGLVGTNPGDTSLGIPPDLGQQICDQAGNCDVQTALVYNEASSVFFVPYRGYGTIGQKENTAVSNYSSLQVNFRHAFGHGLNFQTVYTWSHALDDSTSTYSSSSNGIDDSNLSRWYATSDLNRAQVLVMNYVYELPIFKNSTGALKSLAGGWKVSGITSFYTGQPVDITCGVSGTGTAIGTGVRCNSLGPVRIQKGSVNDSQYGPTPTWFNPAMIAQPNFSQLWANGQAGMFGYQGRNSLTGPGRNNWDLALLKDFQLPWVHNEHSTLQFRWETFNTFNHPQWKYINAGCSSSIGFGQACTQEGNGEVSGDWGPRVVQFGLKFTF
jgi:hypothetical protein